MVNVLDIDSRQEALLRAFAAAALTTLAPVTSSDPLARANLHEALSLVLHLARDDARAEQARHVASLLRLGHEQQLLFSQMLDTL